MDNYEVFIRQNVPMGEPIDQRIPCDSIHDAAIIISYYQKPNIHYGSISENRLYKVLAVYKKISVKEQSQLDQSLKILKPRREKEAKLRAHLYRLDSYVDETQDERRSLLKEIENLSCIGDEELPEWSVT
ncbi:MAG: hypothetical protein KKC03_13585 [Bacteroidetes bacterium]|nr:hypothetical protein [Bacteroidota bacterium]